MLQHLPILRCSIRVSCSMKTFEPEPGSKYPSRRLPDPLTEPSLLSLLPSSMSTPTSLSMPIPMPSHSSSPVPPPVLASSPSSSSMVTPEGSLAVTIMTPQGSGDTEQSSLRNVPSDNVVTQRDLGLDIDGLANEVRAYDRSRKLENEDVIDYVRTLREELRDLADFLHRTPFPSSPVRSERQETPIPRRTVHLVDASVGRSTSISSRHHFLSPPSAAPTSLSRATSNASSVDSYISSRHSDDDVSDEELNHTHSSPLWDPGIGDGDASIDSQSSTSSRSTSFDPSSPEWPPTESLPEVWAPSMPYEPSAPWESPIPRAPPEASTVRPSVDLLHSLGSIRDQLQALESGQDNARTLLTCLLERPKDPTAELVGRLRRIEDLVQILVDQRHPRLEIVENVPPASHLI